MREKSGKPGPRKRASADLRKSPRSGPRPTGRHAPQKPSASKKGLVIGGSIVAGVALLLIILVAVMSGSEPAKAPPVAKMPPVRKVPKPSPAATPKAAESTGPRIILWRLVGKTVPLYSDEQLLKYHTQARLKGDLSATSPSGITVLSRLETPRGVWYRVKVKESGVEGWADMEDVRGLKDPAKKALKDVTSEWATKLAALEGPRRSPPAAPKLQPPPAKPVVRAPPKKAPEPAPPPARAPEPEIQPEPEAPKPVAKKPAEPTPQPEPAPKPPVPPPSGGSILLDAQTAILHGDGLKVETKNSRKNIGFWQRPDQYVEWKFDAGSGGQSAVLITYALAPNCGGQFVLEVGSSKLTGRAVSSGGWGKFKMILAGMVDLPAGQVSLTIKPTSIQGSLMNLASVRIAPVTTITSGPGIPPGFPGGTAVSGTSKSAHFVVTGQMSGGQFGSIADPMFEIWKEKLGSADGKDPKDLKVKVHTSQKDFNEQAKEGARFDLKDGTLHLMYNRQIFQSVATGGTHLYLSEAWPKFWARTDVPPWFVNGLAAYFGSAHSKDGRVEFDSLELPIGKQNLMAFQNLQKSSDWTRFERGFRMKERDYQIRRRSIDLAAWAAFYFLYNSPAKAEGKGTHAGLVRGLLADLESGTRFEAALESALKKGKMMRLSSLERQVKSYFKEFDGKIADREEGDWLVGETAHYTVFVQKGAFNQNTKANDRQILQELKFKMELLFEKYALAFQFQGALSQKAILKLYKNRDSYIASGASPTSAAYYRPSTKELVGYEDSARSGIVFQILCHEGCHQFFDLAFPGFYQSEDIPMWFSEGLADCFGSSRIQGKDLYVFTLSGAAAWRIPVIKERLSIGGVPPLSMLTEMGRVPFMSNAQLHYAASWSFCHFLWNYPRLDGGKGIYREVLINLINGFKTGRPRKEVYADAFKLKGKPINLDVLDKQWRAYVKTLRVRK